MTPPDDPPVEDGQDPPPDDDTPKPVDIQAALAAARERLGRSEPLVPEPDPDPDPDPDDPDPDDPDPDDDPDDPDDPDADDPDADDPDPDDPDDPDADDPDADDPDDPDADDPDDPDADDPDADDDDQERFVAVLPGRGPDDDDIEIEVSDQATADRINHMRNGFMRGEQIRASIAELQGAQEELAVIEDQFAFDPAGFVLDNVDAKQMAQVTLGLLVQEGVWDALQKTINKLVDDPGELRTLRAEAKAARLETKDELKKLADTRKTQNANAAELRDAIDLIIPDTMDDAKRARLVADVSRDLVEHINSQNLKKLDPKSIVTIVADRLELHGIDPLDARKALKSGKPNRGGVSTKKKPKTKPKSGKQLRKASARRKKVAAAPGPGRKAAPTPPKKLQAGQTIKERIASIRKAGGLGKFLGRD